MDSNMVSEYTKILRGILMMMMIMMMMMIIIIIIIIKSLKEETQRMWNAKTEVQHEIIGANGTISKLIIGQLEPSHNQQ
jgi:uncharacterized membrane protein